MDLQYKTQLYVILKLFHLQFKQPFRTYLFKHPFLFCVFVKELHERKIPEKVPEKKKAPPPKGMWLGLFN